jgi:hypothetical protein
MRSDRLGAGGRKLRTVQGRRKQKGLVLGEAASWKEGVVTPLGTS